MTLRALILASALALAACDGSAADAPIAEQWRSIEVSSAQVEFAGETVGRLRFRGGLELRSEERVFGGLSGMEVLDDDRVIAVNDSGNWFEAHLVLNEAGDLAGARDWRTALMRDERGEPFPNKRAGDSEGLAQLSDGRFAVSFEQTQTIRIYDLNRDGPFGPAVAGPPLAEIDALPRNGGLEALTSTGFGILIVGAEGGPQPTAPIWRAPLDAREPVSPSARYPLAPGYSLTGMDRLPEGGYVALERFFAPVIGARARVTRFDFDDGGAIINFEELALLAAPLPMDNYESISAVRGPEGGFRLYIVSDDNHSRRRQRTLLLAFDIIESE